ncbi:acetylglutamate kinase [Aggregatilineales bacterium SYSU G02658]
MRPVVIKISGHELNDDDFLQAFAQVVKAQPEPVVVVHGGGRDITTYQERLGIVPRFVQGLRVTDAESLAIAEMVLCGLVNKRLVRCLLNVGLDALGVSGVDRGLVRARKLIADEDMLFTGEVEAVHVQPLLEWLMQGVTPVIAPICLGCNSSLNVNADAVAAAVARAIGAQRLVYLTNVEGVLDDERRCVPRLTTHQAQAWMASGVISGGMIPKVTTALACAEQGVAAVITNLQGLQTHGGTVIEREKSDG